MAEPVTVVVSGGVPVVDATPLSGTALTNRTTYGVPVTPVSSGARPVTIVLSGAPPVVFIAENGVDYLLGGAGGSPVVLPTAPVLAMDPLWDTTDATPDFIADFDDTVVAGDDFRLQIQAAGGDWSVLLSNTTHTLTAPEDAANEVSLANGSLANANYEARCNVTHGSTSNWSNTVSFTVAAVSSGGAAILYPFLFV